MSDDRSEELQSGPIGKSIHEVSVEILELEQVEGMSITGKEDDPSLIGVGTITALDEEDGSIASELISVNYVTADGTEGRFFLDRMGAAVTGASLTWEAIKGLECGCGRDDCLVAQMKAASRLIRSFVGMNDDVAS